MMRALLALCWALLLVGTAGAWAQTWSEYRPPGGRYRIEMPGTPTVTQVPIKLKSGETVPMTQALLEVGDAALLATYIDYPASITANTPPQQLLGKARDGSAEGHSLRSDKALSVGGYAAREYVIDRKDKILLVSRSVLVGNRLYQLVVATPAGGDPDDARTRRFIDSFNLVSQ